MIVLFRPHDFFQYHLFVNPFRHPMQYHVLNVVCKFHIIMMHASENDILYSLKTSIYFCRWWPF